MKQCLIDNYNIEVIGFIKVTNKVYKIKTNDGFFCLKYTNDLSFSVSYEHIKTLGLNCFIDVYKNKFNEIITKFNDHYFYIMPWVDNDLSIVKELKLKSYFETIAYIHNRTFFHCNVSKDYYEKQVNDIRNVINERKKYYLEMVKSYESMPCRSPAGWVFVLNYFRIDEALNKALCYLDNYQELVSCLDTVRVSIVYNNFDFSHIVMNQNKLLSIDKTNIDICIYDILTMYQQCGELLYDLEVVCMYYMEKVALLPHEKVLLACLLSIVPFVEIETDEVRNIVKMTRLLYYLESSQSLVKYLKIQ